MLKTCSINDLYRKMQNENPLTPKEHSALKSFEQYEAFAMNKVVHCSDKVFINKKTLLLAKRNLEDYNTFLSEKSN